MKPRNTELAGQVAPLAHTIDEAAAILGIGRSLAYELVRAGRLRARKIGRRTIITREDIEGFLRSLSASDVA
jgi:excisionase family DNA binding protein